MIKRRHVSLRTRWRILSNNDFRCQACGRRGIEVNGGVEVDHIVPVSKGGTHEDDNLQVLCYDCNRGKGNQV